MHHAEYAILREHETAQQHNKPTAYTLRRQPASPTLNRPKLPGITHGKLPDMNHALPSGACVGAIARWG